MKSSEFKLYVINFVEVLMLKNKIFSIETIVEEIKKKGYKIDLSSIFTIRVVIGNLCKTYNYEPNGNNIDGKITYQPIVISKQQDSGLNVSESDFVMLKRDSRNRVLIPSEIVKKAKFKKGDNVFVSMKNDILVISKDSKNSITRYSVEDYNKIRVTSKILGMISKNKKVFFASNNEEGIILSF